MEERDIAQERKSSYSGGANGNCVIVGKTGHRVSVRDSKQEGSSKRDQVTFTGEAWATFLNDLRLVHTQKNPVYRGRRGSR